MVLFNIYFITSFLPLSLTLSPYFSGKVSDLPQDIIHNRGYVTVIFTLLTTILAAKIAFIHHKAHCARLRLNNRKLLCLASYVAATTILTYFNARFTMLDISYRLVIQFIIGISFFGVIFFIKYDGPHILPLFLKKEPSYGVIKLPSIAHDCSDQGTLVKIIKEATQSIKLIDNLFVYRASFECMIGTFYEWTMLFSERSTPSLYRSSQPVAISLHDLISKLKISLKEEMGYVPRLFIEKMDRVGQPIPTEILCDVKKITRLLVAAVMRIAHSRTMIKKSIKIELHATHLQIDNRKSIYNQDNSLMIYRAIGLVLSEANTPELPNIKSCYKCIQSSTLEFIQRSKIFSGYIDLHRETIESIIDSIYGYLEYPRNNKNAILLVFPIDIEALSKQATIHTQPPTNYSKPEPLITLKEEADYMIMLMKFSDCICKTFKKIKAETIGGTLLLLKRRFGIKQHASGALFYIRAVGITKIVTQWIFQAPEPIYACLVYDLVRYTDLPIAYIKENYGSSVEKLVQKILAIHTHETMAASLSKAKNYYKKAVDKDHPELFVLYIKLAERLYDLDHAEHYTHLDAVKHMAQETLTTDTKLANKYLDPNIAKALETAAKHAEAYLKKQDY